MRLLFILLLVSYFLAFSSSANARTWCINTTGTGDAPTIQAGVDSATAGDTVLLADGTYVGVGNRDINLLGKAITITSENGRNATIIDCQNLGRAFSFVNGEGPLSVLSGLTIQNGIAEYDFNNWLSGCGGGIYCSGASPTFTNNIIRDNYAEEGGGICIFGGAPIFDNNIFEGNSSVTGGAIQTYNGASITVTNNTFLNNQSGDGGAIECWEGIIVINNNEFISNSCIIWGGAIACLGSSGSISGNAFEGNYGGSDLFGGGGIYCDFGSLVDINYNTFSGNSGSRGGGISCFSASPSISYNTFSGNNAGDGGGISCSSASPSISYNIFSGNSAGQGGGIFCESASPNILYNTFHGNSAYNGGGIFCLFNTANPIISNNIIAFSNLGVGIACQEQASPTVVCCDIFGNAGGDAFCGIDGGGNISEDPLFCDAESMNFHLFANSPCLYGECGRIGANGQGCYDQAPGIISITDVKNDQGRQVRIKWTRSLYDAADDSVTITGYGIYRYQGEFAAGSACKSLVPPDGPRRTGALDGWDYIVMVPARGDSIYQFVAPTLCDSTINDGMCWSLFFVSAMTPEPLVYFDSLSDSGYSLDNLAPAMPQGVEGQYDYAPNLLSLWWHPNTEHDLAGYRVYRGQGEIFMPSEETLIASTPDTLLTGLEYFPCPPWYFKVTAVDFSGNESICAVIPPSEIPIATLVSYYQSVWKGDRVEVSWTLNEGLLGMDVRVQRTSRSNGDYEDLSCTIIRDGKHFHFEDVSVESGETFSYRVYLIQDGKELLAFETTVSVPTLELALKQNYPNPFNPATTIPFTLPERMHVSLVIFDSQGKIVKMLLDDTLEIGLKNILWDGTNATGNPVASGMYFYRLKTSKKTLTKKMLLIK